MIFALRAPFNLAQLNAGILLRIKEHFMEKIGGDVLAAGTGDQETAVLNQLHAAQVNFLVAAQRALHRGAGFGKGGRVKDNHIKLLVGFLRGTQIVKSIGTLETHSVFKAVEAGIFSGAFASEIADIHADDFLCAVVAGMQGKAARVGKAVQHAGVLHKGRDGSAVFLLVKEETSLLPFLDVHPEMHAVFHHFNFVRHFAIQQAGYLLHALQLAHRHVAAFPDAHGVQFLHQGVHNILLEALHAKAQNLQDNHIAKGIGDHSGQAVAFSKDEAAGLEIRKMTAVIDSALHTAVNPRGVDAFIPAA